MRLFLQNTLVALAFASGISAFAADKTPPVAPIWEHKLADFSDADYRYAVEQLFQNYERTTRSQAGARTKEKGGIENLCRFRPGSRHAVWLGARRDCGFGKTRVCERKHLPRGIESCSGCVSPVFCPSLATGQVPFPGHPVYVMESGKFNDTVW